MYRSSNTNQVTIYTSGLWKVAQDQDDDEVLPVSVSDGAMKEKINRGKLVRGEKSVHVIPVVLLLCALILWLFSNPVVINVEGEAAGNINGNKKVEGMGIDADHDSDATEHLPLEFGQSKADDI